MSHSERTPLLWTLDRSHGDESQRGIRVRHDVGDNVHTQFCTLVGCPPSNAPPDYKHKSNEKLLYGRATHLLKTQRLSYNFSAALTNTLLLTQVVLGAALTGLGASGAPSWVVTAFGATNTIIAGLVAYLKSRGQPMRARMFRDDLERVVDEIENSEVMWLGISQGVHGYDEIDTDGQVTVRSEVARLTRLYDRSVRNNTMNNPEMYQAGSSDGNSRAGLRDRDTGGGGGGGFNVALPAIMPAGQGDAAPAAPGSAPVAPAPVNADPDESPASARPKPKEEPKKEEPKTSDDKAAAPTAADGSDSKSPDKDDKGKEKATEKPTEAKGEPSSSSTPTPNPNPNSDPDASPASQPKFTRKESSKSGVGSGGGGGVGSGGTGRAKKVEGEDE